MTYIYKDENQCTISLEKAPIRADNKMLIRVDPKDNDIVSLINSKTSVPYSLYFFNEKDKGPYIMINDDISGMFNVKTESYIVKRISILKNNIFLTVQITPNV